VSFPDARTRILGVIGHPVEHSLSPAIQNAALRHAAVNAVYLAFDASPERFPRCVDGLRELGAIGANVTIPHKEAALALADERAPEADRVGAANTLVFTSGRAVAHNTDIGGVRRALGSLALDPAGTTCLVLGAGGAARSVVWALADAGATRIVVANRTRARAEALGGPVDVIGWDDAPDAAATADLIVNATSVGLDADEAPLGPWALERAASAGCRGVLDLVYRPEQTRLVRDAVAAGIVAADGLDVLVYQGAEAYELFTRAPAPVAIMLQAAHRAAGRKRTRSVADAEDVPPLV
jgi:shikimate dehydrogenase